MGRKWEEFLQEGSLGGVEFDFISTKDKGGRDLDQQEFPGRKGVAIDDRSAKGETHSLVGIFIEDDYPDVMNELLAVLRAGGIMEFIHPVFGASKVAVEDWEIGHDIEDAADAAGITLTLIEHTDAPSVEAASLPAKSNAVRSAAAAASDSASAILDPGFDGPPVIVTAAASVASITTDATVAADAIEAGSETMSVAEIQSSVNGIRSRISSVSEMISDYSSPESFALGRDLASLAQSMGALGDTVIQARPPVVEERVDADIPFLSWVQMKYPDLSTAELESVISEIMDLNEVPDPLTVPLGAQLRRYAT